MSLIEATHSSIILTHPLLPLCFYHMRLSLALWRLCVSVLMQSDLLSLQRGSSLTLAESWDVSGAAFICPPIKWTQALQCWASPSQSLASKTHVI